uniref:CSC1/OSCA1-like 7TM region domain-containing protein n=1 Tax=Alexandrium monilatum TaxID=311494 RepID=A0A7S4PVD5_9DINO
MIGPQAPVRLCQGFPLRCHQLVLCILVVPGRSVKFPWQGTGLIQGIRTVANQRAANQTEAEDQTAANLIAASPNAGNRTTPTNNSNASAVKGTAAESGADVIGFAVDKLRHPLDAVLQEGTTASLMRIRRNSPEDMDSLLSAVVSSTLVVLACSVMLWLLLRFLPTVYGQRSRSQRQTGSEDIPALGDGLVAWASAAAKVPAAQAMQLAGLDALMLGEFHDLCRELFGIISLAGILVIGPLHFLASRMGTADYLASLDVGAVLGFRDHIEELRHTLEGYKLEQLIMMPCWIHAFAVWFVVLVTLRLIFRAQRLFLEHRFRWLQLIPPPRATSLMVEGIPRELCCDEQLKEYYDHLFSAQAIDRTYVVRHTRQLKRLAGEVKKLERELAVARSKSEVDGGSSQPSMLLMMAHWLFLPHVSDTHEALEQKLDLARLAADEERQRVEEAMRQLDPDVCSRSGFVTFTTRRWCRLASREQLRADASLLKMSMPPEPGDVLYEDLARDPKQSEGLQWIAVLLKFAVACLWMPLVVTITAMADLSTLRRNLRFVDAVCQRFPALEATLQGFLATLMLQLLMGKLPDVLMLIITNLQTPKSRAWAQLELQKTYFIFQIVFVLLVTAINQTVLASLQILLQDPHKVFTLLADNLPSSSHFYLNYMAVGCTRLAVETLRSGPLMGYIGFRLLGREPEAAREQAEEEEVNKVSNGHGVRMSRASFMATVALVFCTCTPLIAPLAWAYFAFGGCTYPYLVVYCENRRPDLGGSFWFSGLECLFWGLGLFVLLSVGILSRTGEPMAAAAAGAALVALFVGWSRLQALRGDVLPFETVVDVENAEGAEKLQKLASAGPPAAIYRQPECSAGPATMPGGG